jgi:hypothetical protein
MRSSAAKYLRHNVPQDEIEKVAAMLVEDEDLLRETRDFVDEKLDKDDFVMGIDRGGGETKIKRKRAGRWPIYEVLGKDGVWWEVDDPVWAFAMARLYFQKNRN